MQHIEAALESCQEKIDRRKFCYANSNKDRGGEECFIEELEEKKCLASHLCLREADAFYGGICSKWAESFAFAKDNKVSLPVQREYKEARELVMADKRKIAGCRLISMNLAKCLAQYSPFERE